MLTRMFNINTENSEEDLMVSLTDSVDDVSPHHETKTPTVKLNEAVNKAQ